MSNAPGSTFWRPAVLIRLGFLELLVLFEAGIVIFPPRPGAAPSSRESNASVLLTLIAGPVAFLLVVLTLLPSTLPDDATLVPDRV